MQGQGRKTGGHLLCLGVDSIRLRILVLDGTKPVHQAGHGSVRKTGVAMNVVLHESVHGHLFYRNQADDVITLQSGNADLIS